jgi:peptidoglycan/xylan/chitin deacetylase (PgdA/CDA1 family)
MPGKPDLENVSSVADVDIASNMSKDSMRAEILRRLWSYRREAAGAVLHWSGVGRVFEIVTRPAGAIVLMYHSISPDDIAEYIDPPNRLAPREFERQMAFLSEHRHVVPLSQIVDQIASGASPAAGTVCITFDDGYLDNLVTAAPILEKYGLSATLFLATGYVSRGETQWADVLHWLLQRRAADKLQIPSPCGQEFDLRSSTGRDTARKFLHRRLLEATRNERQQLLTEIEHQLRPHGRVPRLTMSWDDVRELHRRYPFIEIGGHTREHIDLRKHCGDLAREEIDGCAEDIRREIGMLPRYFSFPYSRWCAETRGIVCASGWKAAVGYSDNIRIGQTSDLYVIPRVDAPRTMTDLRFKTSGAYPGVFSILGLS